MPTENTEKKYNIYNKFDPNFVNYGELYKSPREMKQNSKYLINYYADALIKGESPIYKDSPDLVGNRYFINTNSQCLDKNDNTKTHPRSVLVDNVNTSAMNTTKDGNTGLIYSLLASLKTISSDEMFNDISNNQPKEYINNSTDYLKDLSNVPLPLCTEVKVFNNDKKKTVVSGWVTANDRQDIDPKSIEEGFVDMSLMEGELTPSQFSEQAAKTSAAMDEQSKTMSEEAQSSADKVTSEANKAREKGNEKSKSISGNASTMTKNQMQAQDKSSKKAFGKAKKAGMKKQIKAAVQEYLRKNSKQDILFFIKTAINVRYDCAGEIQKTVKKEVITSGQQKLYDKYQNDYDNGISSSWINSQMLKDNLDPKKIFDPPLYAKYKRQFENGIAESVIKSRMLADGLDPEKVLDTSDSEEIMDGDKKTVRIPARCVYDIFEKKPVKDYPSEDTNRPNVCYPSEKISVKNVFNSISNLINTNKTNSKILDVPGVPSQNLCYMTKEWRLPMGFGWTSVNSGYGRSREVKKYEPSKDYSKMVNLLNRYREDFATLIIRYSDVNSYGPCDIISKEEEEKEKKDGFTTMGGEKTLTPYETTSFVNYGAYFFILAMIFIFFFIVYKTLFRALNFKSVFKIPKCGKK